MNNLGLLKSQLKTLTEKEWKVEEKRHGWEIRYTCTLEEFKYHTEWWDINEVNPDLIREEAQMINMSYKRRKVKM